MSRNNGKRVCYYYDDAVGNYYYGKCHPMKPVRIRMTHNLVLNYGLYRKMEVYRPHKASAEDLMQFHDQEYIDFLSSVTPETKSLYDSETLRRFRFEHEDCPIFEGLYDLSTIAAGGSLAAAVKLNRQESNICINWSGGLHHAKKGEASGFCYVNDIVLAILELLKYHKRVVYIDIDVHHGDGVEEAFYTTDRVMTVSFHKYDGKKFFPLTGSVKNIGAGKGKNYAVNVPLESGIDDETYESIFQAVVSKVMETFQPSAVVLQCGADSLVGDRIGPFNLSSEGHGKCVEFVKKFNLPLLMLGGGGYTIRNVSRCWTYETSVALGIEISNELPYNDFFAYFEPDHKLHIEPDPKKMNENTYKRLEKIKKQIFENLSNLTHAPSVQVRAIPADGIKTENEQAEEQIDPDKRLPQQDLDRRIQPANEYSDSEEEGEGGRRDNRSFGYFKKRQRVQDVLEAVENRNVNCEVRGEIQNEVQDENAEDDVVVLAEIVNRQMDDNRLLDIARNEFGDDMSTTSSSSGPSSLGSEGSP